MHPFNRMDECLRSMIECGLRTPCGLRSGGVDFRWWAAASVAAMKTEEEERELTTANRRQDRIRSGLV